jgi:hypothetical protein
LSLGRLRAIDVAEAMVHLATRVAACVVSFQLRGRV